MLQQLLGVEAVWCDTRTEDSSQQFVLWTGAVLDQRDAFESSLQVGVGGWVRREGVVVGWGGVGWGGVVCVGGGGGGEGGGRRRGGGGGGGGGGE